MTSTRPLGDFLLDRALTARDRVLLCAPFVKKAVVSRLLTGLNPTVKIELFTRWRPEEVAAGVSDTDVLQLVESREGRVFLCEKLHAKLFLFDETALLGSANLTGRALGWNSDPNLELLIELPAELQEVKSFEHELRAASIPATAAIAHEIDRVAAMLPTAPPSARTKEDVDPSSEPSGPGIWHPHVREPLDLFRAYADGYGRFTEVSAESASRDLAELEIQPGLGRLQFEALVGARLLQVPLIRRIDDFLYQPRRFGEVRDVLKDALQTDRNQADFVWQTTMRWMLHFLPHRYERSVSSYTEMMVRKELPL